MGTITEIHDYLRLLFARVGEPRCPDHDIPLTAQTVSQMVDNVLTLPEGKRLMLLAPVVKERKGEHTKLLDSRRHRAISVRGSTGKSVISLIRRNWNCRSNTPSKWWLTVLKSG